MFDLFGESGNQPQTKPKSECLNSAYGFPEFWSEWPAGPRKAAKQQCLNKWASLGCADEAEKIRLHVIFMKTHASWQKDGGSFIPAPLVYLNQRRWSEWHPSDVKPSQRIDPALEKILADEKKATPMPDYVRRQREALRGRA